MNFVIYKKMWLIRESNSILTLYQISLTLYTIFTNYIEYTQMSNLKLTKYIRYVVSPSRIELELEV